MALNQVFQNTLQGGTDSNESNILENLIIESMKIYGYDVKYIPRSYTSQDHLFGEDPLNIFDDAITVEMYIKNVEGFEGEGDFLSRFGLEINDQMTLTVSKKRFLQARDENLMNEYGWAILQETGDELQIENATGNNYTITIPRPREGDWIYFPLNNKMFEIKFVEHEDVFYQLGKLYTYDLRCELVDYSSQRINTGHSEVDNIEDTFSLDILDNEIVMETGDVLQKEDGSSIIKEDESPENSDLQANNNYITDQVQANNIIDYSEPSPFGTGFF